MHFTDSSKREDERESQDQAQAETQDNFMDNSIIITYFKGRRGPFSWSFPSIRPVIHPWMASYNNQLQCEGWKTPVVLQFARS